MKKTGLIVISTYPPRECGIAKFSNHLIGWLERVFDGGLSIQVAAINRPNRPRPDYPSQVTMEIDRDDPNSYEQVAERINGSPDIDVINIQHEFGIFGGRFGSHVLRLTDSLKKPFAVTFHTVLSSPPEEMERVVRGLAIRACRLIVMTETSKGILTERFGVDPEKIAVVPHGILPMPFEDQNRAKETVGLTGRTVLMTFGLLSRNKGIEFVIQSLPEVVRNHPDVTYAIVGKTHPEVIDTEGETYRESLIALTRNLGLEGHVRFIDRFVNDEELLMTLQAADIYVSTSRDPNQAVSGTMTYALGSGRPVVSTAFPQAKEWIDPEVGRLVGFDDPKGYAEAIITLLDDPELRQRMERAAFAKTRRMTWPNSAQATLRTLSECDRTLAGCRYGWPEINTRHVRRLTDEFGMIQFSNMNRPDPLSGYTIDDNARGLSLAVRLLEKTGEPEMEKLAETMLRFLDENGRPGRFNPLVGANRQPVSQPDNSHDDAKGRLVMALAQTLTVRELPERIRTGCRNLLDAWLESNPELESLRGAAFLAKGLTDLKAAGDSDPRLERLISRHLDHLASVFEDQSGGDWQWFEPCVSYANGILCESLLSGWRLFGHERWRRIGQASLDFLVSLTFRDGQYQPIGQKDWCRRDGHRHLYDQQPEDTAATVSVLKTMSAIDPSGPYGEMARLAFEWFLGRNPLGQFVYSVATGGCYDGLGEHAVNLNQGAESTVAYLTARLDMER
ncbi:glycosyltransferase family 4 protein [Candidatus Uhrbacteria bacterium]|nr:glycosyltransferase family 4 protein [Candidatus Uhrbacteria bacterium]